MAFKEWALVCEALGGGRQSIILRKGGIAEGRQGFRFEHAEFLLFPTGFHEQVQKLTLPAETPLPALEEARHCIRWGASVEWTRELTDWEQIAALAPYHLWREEVLRERFEYEGRQSISLAFLRIFELAEPHVFENEPKYGGCRSWVKIPDPPEQTPRRAVLGEDAHRGLEKKLLATLV